jgi:hypothetical protein
MLCISHLTVHLRLIGKAFGLRKALFIGSLRLRAAFRAPRTKVSLPSGFGYVIGLHCEAGLSIS